MCEKQTNSTAAITPLLYILYDMKFRMPCGTKFLQVLIFAVFYTIRKKTWVPAKNSSSPHEKL